ncbi:hypothetical protein HPB50_019518 [Hyalomma asiaticum]|uniref:Uncharacterized protein n=1 Tax=Hyalomma asiaticum TaxID=266040 RepID=A0ACB7T808_HYAAI|nr:hypothetical protein HPB50_019518 [Hyalomma asiaticum]
MKTMLTLAIVGLLAATVRGRDELCDLADDKKLQAVQCITSHASAELKSKWDTLKQTFGNQDDLATANKLCELRTGAAESSTQTVLFTKAEEDEIKSAFEACRAAPQPKTR